MKMLSHSRTARAGFTLVELLVVIAIIGVLVGMLSVALVPALLKGKEGAIISEMNQLSQAVESFKNQYGFYPPTFGPNGKIQNAVQLRAYVNRMSPNNAEWTPSGHGSETRLQHWYDEVGKYLDRESSLVFWLSGTCKNKQYPITGGWTSQTAPLAAHAFGQDGIERDVFFDFRTSQLYGIKLGENVYVENTPLPSNLKGVILEYHQPHGPTHVDGPPAPNKVNLAYHYLDHSSYAVGGAYYKGTPLPANFINPKTFQLVSFGMDGLPGNPGNAFVPGPKGRDNLCNFANGRLEKWIAENQ